MRFLRFLVRPVNDTAFAHPTGSFTPVGKYSEMEFDPRVVQTAAVFQNQLKYSQSTPIHPAWVSIEEILEKGIEQALYKKLSPEQALLMIDTDCAKVLQENAQR